MTDPPPLRVRWIDVPALVCFALLATVVLLQFLTRYVLDDSLAWTEEIARYLLIGTAYAGSVSALRKGAHIFLELAYRLAPPSNVKALAIMSEAVIMTWHAILTFFAAQLAIVADRRMVSVELPTSIVYGFVALTLAVATAISVRNLVRRCRQRSDEIVAEIEQASNREDAAC